MKSSFLPPWGAIGKYAKVATSIFYCPSDGQAKFPVDSVRPMLGSTSDPVSGCMVWKRYSHSWDSTIWSRRYHSDGQKGVLIIMPIIPSSHLPHPIPPNHMTLINDKQTVLYHHLTSTTHRLPYASCFLFVHIHFSMFPFHPNCTTIMGMQGLQIIPQILYITETYTCSFYNDYSSLSIHQLILLKLKVNYPFC